MKKKIKKIAVIGTCVIGTGWVIRFLLHKKKVYAYDLSKKHKKKLVGNQMRQTVLHSETLFKKC